MRPNRNINLWQEQTPIYKLSEKHPKRSKFAITDMRQKNIELFVLHDTSVGFNSRNNFANLGSFAKVFGFFTA